MQSLQDFVNKYQTNAGKELLEIPKKDKRANFAQISVPERGQMVMLDTLHLPSDNGYMYSLVAIDVATNNVDAEPMRDRTALTIREAFKIILKRKFIKSPSLIITDAGQEFKGVFKQYLKDKDIGHQITRVGRHTQTLNVDRLYYILGKHLNLAMLEDEIRGGKTSRKWKARQTELIKILNSPKYIKKPETEINVNKSDIKAVGSARQVLPVGTRVRVKLDAPVDNIEQRRLHGKFRAGDARYSHDIHTIKFIYMNPNQPVLYQVSGINDCVYIKSQLLVVKD
jgi:hypothetical protein